MKHLFLLLLPAIVYSQCPGSYFMDTKRVPTARNNFTEYWCIGLVPNDQTGIRETARSVCAYWNSTLTVPESEEEFTLVSRIATKNNITDYWIAVDGQFSPHCKAKMLREPKFDARNSTGDCSLHKNLFDFDDPIADPTFALNKYSKGIPDKRRIFGKGETQVIIYNDCLSMLPDAYDSLDFPQKDVEKHTKRRGEFAFFYCPGEEIFNSKIPFFGALCATPMNLALLVEST